MQLARRVVEPEELAGEDRDDVLLVVHVRDLHQQPVDVVRARLQPRETDGDNGKDTHFPHVLGGWSRWTRSQSCRWSSSNVWADCSDLPFVA